MNKYIVTLLGFEHEKERFSFESDLTKEEILKKLSKKGYRKWEASVETLEEFWQSRKSNYIKTLLK